MASEVGLDVAAGSLDYWAARLERYGTTLDARGTRFGEPALSLVDPHGLRLALIEGRGTRPFTPWDESPVPAERQVRGLHGARLVEREPAETTGFLQQVLGFRELGREDGWTRYGFEGVAGVVDIQDGSGARRGAWGVGSVHHLAWRVDDEAHQAEVRARIEAAGNTPTPVIDRFWFKSVYFKEPGGVLFELATDGPGFAVDESPEHLGERLVLPPWLERSRAAIERALPDLTMPARPTRA